MIGKLILRPIKSLAHIQLGQSKIRKFIPTPLFKQIKVWKYDLWLAAATLSRNQNVNLIQLIKFIRQDRKCILFYPDIPYETACISLICLERGYKITNNLSGHYDAAFKWKDATYFQPDEKLCRLAMTREVENFYCNNISKDHVDEVFMEVFGYSSRIDPRTYKGKCVQKSEINAKHDGKIVDCPVETPEEGVIYQIMIDNRVDDQHVMDIRVPIYKDFIPPRVITWTKPVEDRFQVDIGERRAVEVSEIFTEEEQKNILRFCRKIGLDYGELDILRNQPDGRIYIVDANNTPDCGEILLDQERGDIKEEALLFESAFLK